MSDSKTTRAYALRLGATAAAIGLFVWLTDLRAGDMLAAIARVGVVPFVVGTAASLGNLGVGALRWRALLRAYGGRDLPPIGELFRLYLVGHFFNTFVPANVAGDLARAHLTRESVGAPGAFAIVLVERVLGFAGLFAVVAAALALRPTLIPLPAGAALAAALAMAAAAFAVAPVGRALGRRFPGGPLARLADLPPAPAASGFAAATALSIVSQLVAAWVGYLVFRDSAGLGLADALLVVPVGLLATYLPTVAGLGARETAFVLLLRPFGVSDAVATAGSLAIFLVLVASAAIAGITLLVPATKRTVR